MTRTFSSSAHVAYAPAYRVKAPHASDAIGLALRCAYDEDVGMPDDIAALLHTLDSVDEQRSH